MEPTSIRAAWGGWLDEHANRLLLFARQQCRRPADADDVVQEALVEAWQRAGGEQVPPLPLVYATIRRRAIDRARSEDRRAARERESLPADDAWFDADPADREFSVQVEAAVKKLPPEQAEVVLLKLWSGLTFAEIAETLAIPANTAASRYRYGLETLRADLEEHRP